MYRRQLDQTVKDVICYLRYGMQFLSRIPTIQARLAAVLVLKMRARDDNTNVKRELLRHNWKRQHAFSGLQRR
jgi:hypothetical protein